MAAWIRKRISNRTGRTTFRVCWREGGTRDGREDGETCDSVTVARKFKAKVEAAGDRRPEGYPPGCRGLMLQPAEPVEPADTAAAVTLTAVVYAYLAWLSKTGKANSRQVAGYRRLYDAHVRGAIVTLEDKTRLGPLGGLSVTEVVTEVIQAWVFWMSGRTYLRKGERIPYSPKTISNVHGGVISPARSWAARQKTIPIEVNPCVGVILPERPGRTVTLEQVPTGLEIADWIAIAYQVSQLAGDIVTLAMGTGLRWGEMIALRPVDIDLRRKLLTVAQVVKEDEHRRNYLAPYAKSDAGLRTIRIPDSVVLMLKRRMKDAPAKGLIFTGARGGILNSSGWHQTHWSKVVEKARERQIETAATPHKFRHAHALSLLAENVSLDTVSKRLGHESIVITADVYGHLSPEADRQAADVIDTVMAAPRDPDPAPATPALGLAVPADVLALAEVYSRLSPEAARHAAEVIGALMATGPEIVQRPWLGRGEQDGVGDVGVGQRPGEVGEQFLGPPVGQAGPPGDGVEVCGGQGDAGFAFGEEHRPLLAPVQQLGQQAGCAGLPDDDIHRRALAGDLGAPVLQIQVLGRPGRGLRWSGRRIRTASATVSSPGSAPPCRTAPRSRRSTLPGSGRGRGRVAGAGGSGRPTAIRPGPARRRPPSGARPGAG
ncbi:site-specific integrase [Sphaerisporangium album]|uniref:Site-specific integrase n=1 Tax=Sphaerisporangium album TaxID=509200 RepID=A0A367FJI7_9ACTN|nr:site-specific integrase [Sphaerisporangium album]RCG30059.1 site-specific integrase [Sphaerisporangium album]